MEQIRQLKERGDEAIYRLLAVWESAVKETHTFLSVADIENIKPEVVTGLKGVEQLYCFYDENGVAQGFLGVENDKIEMLFVDAAFRGRGAGKHLLQYAISHLCAKYVDVNEQNGQGVGFYRHMGFRQKGRSDLDSGGRPFPILHLEWNPS